MVQRSRIASLSDAGSPRRPRGKSQSRPGKAAMKQMAVVLLLAGSFYALPKLLGPGFVHDRLSGALGFAAAAGEWGRSALAVAFESIPVR